MPLRTVLLDFDGTLTDPASVTAAFLDDYRRRFLAEADAPPALWDEAEAAVTAASSQLGWMLDGWEACPAAADPYILASAVSSRVLASIGAAGELLQLPQALYGELYVAHAAPFRPEAPDVLEALVARGLRVAVISNASTSKIERRLDQLLGAGSPARAAIAVRGDARKFSVRPAQHRGAWRARFDALPSFTGAPGLGRPTWLRRGAFFDRMAEVWEATGTSPDETVFCGDIWELDLALPAALGCAVQLVERGAPLATHEPERLAVAASPRAAISADLRGLLAQVGLPLG